MSGIIEEHSDRLRTLEEIVSKLCARVGHNWLPGSWRFANTEWRCNVCGEAVATDGPPPEKHEVFR